MSKQVDPSVYSLPLFNEDLQKQVDLCDVIAAAGPPHTEVFHAPYIGRPAPGAPNGYRYEILERKDGDYAHLRYCANETAAAMIIEGLVIRDAKIAASTKVDDAKLALDKLADRLATFAPQS